MHGVFAVLLWILFGYYWYVVGQRSINPATIDAVLGLGSLVAIGVILTMVWVAHNLRLSRKFGRRKGFAAPAETFDKDYLARPLVHPPVHELRTAKIVTVSLDDEGRKVYAVGGEVAD
jgi:uncharacterized membrane protein YbhN (UPF0104 family)